MRIIILAVTVFFLLPMLSPARNYSAQTGRFMTMDTYESDKQDPQSLHKYLYAHADPVNKTDPSVKAVYKVKYKSSFPLIDHRVIVGDTGTNYSSSCYLLEFWGNDGIWPVPHSKYDFVKWAKWNYSVIPRPAMDEVNDLIAKAGSGKLVETVKTSFDVDQFLNQQASTLNHVKGIWVMIDNDCGTGANEWLYYSQMEQFARHPVFVPTSIIYHNYIDSVAISVTGFGGF